MVHIKIPGYEKELYIHTRLAENLEVSKKAVLNNDWDYVAIVSGLPGVGKSTFAHQLCKFFDPTFDIDRVCFTAQEFRAKTTNGTRGQAFMLDESFADMNSQLSRDPEFIATLNHLQVIRKKNLFLIIVLPDFFTLNKNIAVFRASHLFVVYSENYSRGDFAVFDRTAKSELYYKGKPFTNYQAVDPNFRGDYNKPWFIDKEEYERRKDIHLEELAKVKETGHKASIKRDLLAYFYHEHMKTTNKVIGELVGSSEDAVQLWVKHGKERFAALQAE